MSRCLVSALSVARHACGAMCISPKVQLLPLRLSRGRVVVGHASDGVDHGRCGDLLVVAWMMSPMSSDYRRGCSSLVAQLFPWLWESSWKAQPVC